MKIKISKKLKIGLISILVLLIGFISFQLYKEVKYRAIEEQKVQLYSYNNSGTVSYKVFLKPNLLYSTNLLGRRQDLSDRIRRPYKDYI